MGMKGATTMDGVLGAKNGANWGEIIAEAVCSYKSNTFLCAYYIVLLAPHICDAQTKRRHVSPWCEDDVDVLGLGAAMIWVTLEAISAPHHGQPIFSANGASTEPFFEYVDLYVGLVQFWIKKTNDAA